MDHDVSYFSVPEGTRTRAKIDAFLQRKELVSCARYDLATRYGSTLCVGLIRVEMLAFDNYLEVPPSMEICGLLPSGSYLARPANNASGKRLALEFSRSLYEMPSPAEFHHLLGANPFCFRASYCSTTGCTTLQYADVVTVEDSVVLRVPNRPDGSLLFIPPEDCLPLRVSSFFAKVENEETILLLGSANGQSRSTWNPQLWSDWNI
jgi:hypothetical protein